MITATTQMANAWIFLNEDEPSGTDYNSPNSCYQTLINNHVYQSVNLLFLCFATTKPAANGAGYTIEIGNAGHPNGLTNQDYMKYILRDARAKNPMLKFSLTLNWGDGTLLSNIFPDPANPDQKSAALFAQNVLHYLQENNMDGFDIDWESPISNTTTVTQFKLIFSAIGELFKKQSRKYYLTLSPAEVGNLDADTVNTYFDFINLQLYSGFTFPDNFKRAGVNPDLFAYGAKFESNFQTAQQAYDAAKQAGYNVITNWRLNSTNYVFEQDQQKILSTLVFPDDDVAEDIRQMQEQIKKYGSLTQFGIRIQSIEGPGAKTGNTGYINARTGGKVQQGSMIASWEVGNWGNTMTLTPNPD